jgi:hypothetical protein
MSQLDKTMELSEDKSNYFCRFARYTNLNYACKLGTLLTYLDIKNSDQIQN